MSEVRHQVSSSCRDAFVSNSGGDSRWCEDCREWSCGSCNATREELAEDLDGRPSCTGHSSFHRRLIEFACDALKNIAGRAVSAFASRTYAGRRSAPVRRL
jgi:hypothetical protein